MSVALLRPVWGRPFILSPSFVHLHIIKVRICDFDKWLKPSPVCGFLQHPTCRGAGSVAPPSRSAPDVPRALRKNERIAPQWEEADGIQFYGPRSTGDLRGHVKHPNLVTWDGDLADAIRPTKASESLSEWLRTVQITLILTLCEKGPQRSS